MTKLTFKQTNKEDKITFPCLKINKFNNMVVLFFSFKTGIIIHDFYGHVGNIYHVFNPKKFKPFYGTVTITQEE